MIIANKMDEVGAEENLKIFKEKLGDDIPVFPVIALIQEGVDMPLYAIADLLDKTPSFATEEEEVENSVLYKYESDDEIGFEIFNEGNLSLIHICPNCGSPVVIKRGRFGEFKACSAYPKCKTIIK